MRCCLGVSEQVELRTQTDGRSTRETYKVESSKFQCACSNSSFKCAGPQFTRLHDWREAAMKVPVLSEI